MSLASLQSEFKKELSELLEVVQDILVAGTSGDSELQENLKQREQKLQELSSSFVDAAAARATPEPSVSQPRSEPPVAMQQPPELRYGQAVSAGMYFTLESILSHCRVDRLSLFLINKRNGELLPVYNVGPGVPKVRKGYSGISSTSILNSVLSTGIGCNLRMVNLDDVADCPGPTKGKNALILPVRSYLNTKKCIGVIILVNKCGGLESFNTDDELAVFHSLSTVAYLSDVYPQDISAQNLFDPSPLAKIVPVGGQLAPVAGMPSSWVAPCTQLMYYREGNEKFIRKQNLVDDSRRMSDEGVAKHLRSVETYIRMIEDCWKSAVVQNMETERQLKQKSNHISEAKEILHRKQRKVDMLKDTLCEHIQKASMDSQKQQQ